MDVRRPFFAFCQNTDFQMLSWSEECIKTVSAVWIHSSSLLRKPFNVASAAQFLV